MSKVVLYDTPDVKINKAELMKLATELVETQSYSRVKTFAVVALGSTNLVGAVAMVVVLRWLFKAK